jgi:hypothetical protein
MPCLCNHSPYRPNGPVIGHPQEGIALNLTYIRSVDIT